MELNKYGVSFFQHSFAAPPQLLPRRKLSLHGQATPTSRTQRIMESIQVNGEVGGAGGVYSYNALKRMDNLWSSICSASPEQDREKIDSANSRAVVQEQQQVVTMVPTLFRDSEMAEKSTEMFDIIVCGGTLGIFVATALSSRGLRVGIVEKAALQGREQEWNISRKELLELVEVGILTEDDIDHVIAASFNPNRCGFEGKGDIWVTDILNLGVSPARLIEIMRKRFTFLGGAIFEGCGVSNIFVYEDAAVRLPWPAMNNLNSIIFSSLNYMLHFAEMNECRCYALGERAFPAGSGPLERTIYMFTYLFPEPGCPKLEELLEDYWELMPKYQGVSLEDLEVLRVIYGIFPTYRDSPEFSLLALTSDFFFIFSVNGFGRLYYSPLPAAFDRVLQFGDASGVQSPVSFGGFGSLTRHLGRLTDGIHEAVNNDFLDARSLSFLNPYMPNLSASWLFQRAMSAKKQSNVSPNFINELLFANFQSMQKLGDPVIRPFLQDVIQFGPLVKTLGLVMLTRPLIIPSIFKKVGIPVLFDWSGHFVMLGLYTFLSSFIDPLLRPLLNSFPTKTRYEWKRRLEAWKYGSGLDYRWHNSGDHERRR
ncbi:hypothetical protein F511_23412 [Dorcoceras hygrometricum]|uniref:Uncharacterized protein n=1 Tax=Dorcoceras hygrometricum TaxID=472368 RepID=A0A2Z7BQR6_9LAMI|nr:hypothetical protein F511_23412 [Dorcoceras hygrometricum]